MLQTGRMKKTAMKKIVFRDGITLGFITGLITSLFDGLYMLSGNTCAPPGFAFTALLFNILLWTTLGVLAGAVIRAFPPHKAGYAQKKNLYWTLCYLCPFALLYGILGKISIHIDISAAFDHHLSFLWVFLVLLIIVAGHKKNILRKSCVCSFIPELLLIAAIFHFCSNAGKIIVTPEWLQNVFFFETDSIKTVAVKIRIFTWSSYVISLIVFLVCYVLLISKIRLNEKRQPLLIACLAAVVISALSAFSFVNYRMTVTRDYQLPPGTNAVEKKRVPYVFLIVLDTVRADRLSMYGPHKTSPNLEELSRSSVIFENCIASSPWTLPSHVSLFTGLYPVEHGSHQNKDLKKISLRPMSKTCTTLADVFAAAGYRTAGIVANHVMLNRMFNVNKGFDIYTCFKNIGSIYKYPYRPLLPLFCYATNILPKYFLSYMPAEELNKSVEACLERLSPDPFFVFINYMDAHAPYCPPRPFSSYFAASSFPQIRRLQKLLGRMLPGLGESSPDTFDLSQYDGEIAYLDHHLGKLFAQLKTMGIYNSSLIVVTSDHGELFNEHGLHGHQCSMYEGVIKVPLLIKFPYSKKSVREPGPITLSDLYPTMLSTCGLPVPQGVSGNSFGSRKAPVVSEFYSYGTGRHRALFLDRYKYMTYEKQKQPELYDLEADPRERRNLAETHQGIRTQMNLRLLEWDRAYQPKYSDTADKAGPLDQDLHDELKALGYIK